MAGRFWQIRESQLKFCYHFLAYALKIHAKLYLLTL